jgi:hypothetical protein
MKLAPNIKLGQLRRTVAIVSPSEWNSLTRAERDAANAITFLIWKRAHTKRHPAFGGDEIFLTKGYVQRLLKAVNATNMGEKAARTALARMQERGWIVDTGGRRSRGGPRPASTSRTIRRRRHSSRGRTLSPAGTSAFVLVAGVPSTCTHEGLGLDAARGIPDIQSRAALPSVSVGIPASSRRDFEAETTLAVGAGLGSVGLPAFGATVTFEFSPSKTAI